jgi:asparagine synthase (glutamine-hydrolysing)
MSDPGGRYWLTFNGEIYNHRALREQLAALGHTFVSASDTEVLLHACIEWGADCLSRLNGIFSFVLFDAASGELLAARDRFGVKPLYVWRGANLVALASEIKQFTALPGWHASIHRQRAYDFLHWNLLDHTSQTLFEGVAQLQGGEMLHGSLEQLRAGTLAPRRWYRLEPDPAAAGIAWPEAVARFRELLDDSVTLQLRADVPVGSCLSGGLDSSSIVCLASRHLAGAGAGQHAFSARASVAAYDEGRFIEAVLRHTGVEGHQVTPAPDPLWALLPAITWHQDEPFGSTSIYAQWAVFALARTAGVKVVLDGQGADEMLAGYHGFFGPRLAALLREGRWSALARESRRLQQLHGYSAAHVLARMTDALLPDRVRQALRRAAGKPSATASPWLDLSRLGCRPEDPFEALGARRPGVRNLSRTQLVATNLPMLLHWEDRSSMAHGVEARVPFLDHRLVEFALGLPDDYKLADGTTKRILREAMRGILPEEVRERRDKLGFVTPEEAWVRRAPQPFRQALDAAVQAAGGIIRPEVLRDFNEMVAGRRGFNHDWWRVISFGAWLARFDVSA